MLKMQRDFLFHFGKCYRRMLGMSYTEHKTNEYVSQQVDILDGRQELSLSTIKRCKLSWFGHVCRHDTLPKQGTVEGSRHVGRLRKSWKDNIKEDRPVDVIIVVHRGWQRSMGSHHRRCICRNTPMTPERHGYQLISSSYTCHCSSHCHQNSKPLLNWTAFYHLFTH